MAMLLLCWPVASAAARVPSDASAPYVVVTTAGRSIDSPLDALAEARDSVAAQAADRLVQSLGVRPGHRYRWAVEGFAAHLTPAQVAFLRADPQVRAVVPDIPISGEDDTGPGSESGGVRTTGLTSQVVPSGVRRVNGDDSPIADIDGRDERVDVDVAILDSGIADHPDLAIAGGHDCTSPYPDAWRDRYGHGTHVAGIVGAIDDGKGVVGVAPGARLWAIKVLGDNDEGSLSTFLCGLDWVVAQRDPTAPSRPLIEVANMSLSSLLARRDDRDCGGPSGDVIHQAICASVADGTVYAVAAGNQGYDASYRLPAAYDEVITVSALADYDGRPGGLADQSDYCPFYSYDRDDTYADFSNSGVDVDLIAPGKCILSTYTGKRWAWMSGTSMATPTVAGAAALYVSQHPGVRPGQVRMALRHVANLQWATSTDPDGDPDPLLDVATFDDAPVFRIVVDPVSGRLARGGFIETQLEVQRVNGHDAAVSLSIRDVPTGVTATLREGAGGGRAVVLRAADDAPTGTFQLTVQGTDGEIVRTEPLTVTLTGGATTVFSSPDGPPPVIGRSADVVVAWSESGSGTVTARTIARHTALPAEPGTCTGAAWVVDEAARPVSEVDPDGSPSGGWSFTDSGFATDGCYRWVVALTDGEGRIGRWSSGAVIVDGTAPPAPNVVATGERVWQRDANDTVWVRQGSGTLRLEALGRDVAGGTVSTRFGPLQTPDGWTYSPGSVAGDPASRSLSWGPAAADTSLEIRSTDAMGAEGAARRVELRIDGSAPDSPKWTTPASGTLRRTSGDAEVSWGGATDTGAGLASEQLVQRQRGPVVSTGTCSGVVFQDDGAARLLARHARETGLASGYCYRWRLTARDRVGNLGATTTSGKVLIDQRAPVGDFTFPEEGSFVTRAKTSLSIRWTQSDGGGSGDLERAVERERARAVQPDRCTGLRWRLDGGTSTAASPHKSTGLREGYCYRWRLVLIDGAGNFTTVISGTVQIRATSGLVARRIL
jgi:subtilisin family serine protease